MKEESVSSEFVISTCLCNEIVEPILTATFVVYDEEEGGYIRYMNIDEKCKLCGNVVNSYGDIDFDATEEDYRLYLEKRVSEGAVLCPYCQCLFDSESWLAKHITVYHTGIVKQGGR